MVKGIVKTDQDSILQKWSRRLLCVVIALAMSVCGRVSWGKVFDTQKIGPLVGQLASADPAIRELAEQELMGLKRSDLPALREAALSQRPLGPGQVVALHEVVMQVFLAGEPFAANLDESGFLGVSFGSDDVLRPTEEIRVVARIPGFPGFQYLQTGDVVVKLPDWPNLAVRHPDDVIEAIKHLDPGNVVRLGIVRHGRYATVSIPLDFRPVELPRSMTESEFAPWVDARKARADEYWESEFSVINPAVQSVSMATKANSEERSKTDEQ